jgi:hypothetical protein
MKTPTSQLAKSELVKFEFTYSLILTSLIAWTCAAHGQANIYGYAATPTHVAPAGTLVQFQLTRPMNNYPIYMYQQSFSVAVTTNGYWIATNVQSGIYNVIIGPNVNAVQIDVPANTNTYNVLDIQQLPYLLLNAANYIPLLALSTNNAPAGYVATSTGSNWIAAPNAGGAATNATLFNLFAGSATLTTSNTTGLSNGLSGVLSNNGVFTIVMTNASSVTAAALAAQGQADTNYANMMGTAVTNYVNSLGQAVTNGYNLLGTAVTNWANATFATITGMNNLGTAITNWATATFSTGGSSGVGSFAGLTGAITILASQLSTSGQQLNASPMGAAVTNFANTMGTAVTNGFNLLGTAVTNWGNATFQPLATILTTFAGLANGSGYLHNNGSGTLAWSNPGGSGTVTSVTFTGDGVLDSSTPSSAVTSSGTVTATLLNAPANTVFGNTGASAAAPAYTGNPSISNLTFSGNLTGTGSSGPAYITIGGNYVTTNAGIVYMQVPPGSNLLCNLAPYTNTANLIIAVVCTNWVQVTFTNPPPVPFLFRALQGASLTNSVWFNTNLATTSNSFPCHYATNLVINLIPTTSTNSCLEFPITLNGATNLNIGTPNGYSY